MLHAEPQFAHAQALLACPTSSTNSAAPTLTSVQRTIVATPRAKPTRCGTVRGKKPKQPQPNSNAWLARRESPLGNG
jgi:hypothetical protein